MTDNRDHNRRPTGRLRPEHQRAQLEVLDRLSSARGQLDAVLTGQLLASSALISGVAELVNTAGRWARLAEDLEAVA